MKKDYICLGIMSGTSVDGVDTGLFKVELNGSATSIKLIAGKTYPIEPELRNEILAQMGGCDNALHRLTLLNMRLGKLYAQSANALLDETGISSDQVEVIGSHGQTMFHVGRPVDFIATLESGTLQIGEGSVIAQQTGIPTVTDFRTADMAVGGEGAPFVPLLDRILSTNFPAPVAFQNIGGIGNVGYIHDNKLTAFDTGPGNMIMDRIAEIYSNGKQFYDKDGAIALKGKLNTPLLKEWLAHPYLKETPPKTTGRELYGDLFFKDYPLPDLPLEDILHTATIYTATTIADSYKNWLPVQPKTVIVSGGGAHNPLIMKTLKEKLPESNVMTGDEAGISSDFKEAGAFALMALFYTLDRPGNEPEATGAEDFVITGKLSKPLPKRNK